MSGDAMKTMSRRECMQLLGTKQVGRLGVIAGGYPVIVPVNYGLDGEAVVIRSDPGTKLDAAAYERVTFEVDDIDDEHHAGWSVLLRGCAWEVRSEEEVLYRGTHAADPEPWAGGEKGHWLRIAPTQVTGRRLPAQQ